MAEDKITFFNIVPDDHKYREYTMDSIPLKVIRDDGVEVTPNIRVNSNELSNGNRNFWNVSGSSDSFKVNVIIHKDEEVPVYEVFDSPIAATIQGGVTTWHNRNYYYYKLTKVLDYWIRNTTVLSLTTNAIDVSDGKYLITGNSKRTQTYDDYTIWELEFSKYIARENWRWQYDNKISKKAVENYYASKKKTETATATKTATVKSSETTASKLKKCNTKVLVYSKKKKVVDCVKYLQTILKKKGHYTGKIDGWFGIMTLQAVKKFQTENKKKYGLTANGKVDAKTLKALYS